MADGNIEYLSNGLPRDPSNLRFLGGTFNLPPGMQYKSLLECEQTNEGRPSPLLGDVCVFKIIQFRFKPRDRQGRGMYSKNKHMETLPDYDRTVTVMCLNSPVSRSEFACGESYC